MAYLAYLAGSTEVTFIECSSSVPKNYYSDFVTLLLRVLNDFLSIVTVYKLGRSKLNKTV